MGSASRSPARPSHGHPRHSGLPSTTPRRRPCRRSIRSPRAPSPSAPKINKSSALKNQLPLEAHQTPPLPNREQKKQPHHSHRSLTQRHCSIYRRLTIRRIYTYVRICPIRSAHVSPPIPIHPHRVNQLPEKPSRFKWPSSPSSPSHPTQSAPPNSSTEIGRAHV